MKLSIVVVLCLLVVGLCLGIVGTAHAQTATIVNISPSSQTVSTSQSFNVSVYVTPGEPIAGMQFTMSFNASLIQVNSVTEGNLLNQGGCDTYFVHGKIDNTAGTIIGVAGAITTPGCNVSTPGTFVNISFTTRDVSGTSFLNMSGVVVGDETGSAVSISLTNGSVTVVQLPGDVNGDGHVNVLDMVRVGQHWGQTGSTGWIPEDVKIDGVINVLDMIVIGQHWTG